MPTTIRPTKGVKRRQVKNPFQNVMPSRSILFAETAQAMTHSSPAIASDSQPAAIAKCIGTNIVAPKKPQAAQRPAVYVDSIVNAAE